jgi:hypothetical protein
MSLRNLSDKDKLISCVWTVFISSRVDSLRRNSLWSLYGSPERMDLSLISVSTGVPIIMW